MRSEGGREDLDYLRSRAAEIEDGNGASAGVSPVCQSGDKATLGALVAPQLVATSHIREGRDDLAVAAVCVGVKDDNWSRYTAVDHQQAPLVVEPCRPAGGNRGHAGRSSYGAEIIEMGHRAGAPVCGRVDRRDTTRRRDTAYRGRINIQEEPVDTLADPSRLLKPGPDRELPGGSVGEQLAQFGAGRGVDERAEPRVRIRLGIVGEQQDIVLRVVSAFVDAPIAAGVDGKGRRLRQCRRGAGEAAEVEPLQRLLLAPPIGASPAQT